MNKTLSDIRVNYALFTISSALGANNKKKIQIEQIAAEETQWEAKEKPLFRRTLEMVNRVHFSQCPTYTFNYSHDPDNRIIWFLTSIKRNNADHLSAGTQINLIKMKNRWLFVRLCVS